MTIAGRMDDFTLSEVSLVRSPAQRGALAMFAKREFTDAERERLAGEGKAMEGGQYPIENKEDLRDAIEAFGRAKDPAEVRAHIIAQAKALDAEDMLPESWKVASDDEEEDDGDDEDDDDDSPESLAKRGERILKAQGYPRMSDPLAPGYGEIGGADRGVVGATKPGYGETMAGAGRPAGDAGTANRWPDHPQRDVDWAKERQKASDGLEAMAKARHQKDRTKSVEKHYSEILKEPGGADLYALAR